MPIPTPKELDDLIEGLIAYRDAMDGDPDFEIEEPDQPAAEWTGRGAYRFNVGVVA